MSVLSRPSSQPPATESLVLVPISTEVPQAVVDRLRAAALHVGIRQGDMIALALDAFLEEEGF